MFGLITRPGYVDSSGWERLDPVSNGSGAYILMRAPPLAATPNSPPQ
jgi:hypothetical protein